jgi:hypothetical protein
MENNPALRQDLNLLDLYIFEGRLESRRRSQ